ncbi:MAG TPA: hypothetical protein VKZ58_06180 [Longimicrobiales bacterium]|nr:hypothetical protein [Longimicrobiales bacterium]
MAHDNFAAYRLPLVRLERTPAAARTAIIALLVVGVIGFVASVLTDPTRAWRAYLYNWLFFTSIAQGAIIFSAATIMARGVWARGIRRIAQSTMGFLPIAFVLLIPIFFVGGKVFPWVEHPVPGKDVWLNIPFLAVRSLVLLGILFYLSSRFVYWSLRPDAGALRDRVPDRLRGVYDRLTRNWQGQAVEEERAERNLSRLGPALALVYAVAFSFVAWDYVMSLEPHWFSTLIGPYFFMGAFLGGIALTALTAVICRGTLGLEKALVPPQFHDLGKMTFGFCVFWAYMFWSQYIVIWYGQLPWEQAFLIHRLSKPYGPFALFVFLGLFVIPFFGLLGVKPKKTPSILATFAALILFALWIERYVLVYPSLYLPDTGAVTIGWQEIVTALPFAGLLLMSMVNFATRFPILQQWIPSADKEILLTSGEPVEAVAGD